MASRDPAIPLWVGHVRSHATADIRPPAMYWFAVGMGCGILRQRAALQHARVSEIEEGSREIHKSRDCFKNLRSFFSTQVEINA